ELETLFESIAPTVQLYQTGAELPSPPELLSPPDTSALNLVAWQHRGIGFDRENIPRRHRSSLGSSDLYQSIRLNRPPGREPLFEARPDPGEVVNKSIGRGLSAQVPLALYSDEEQTLRPDEVPSPTALRDTLEEMDVPVLNTNEALRLANVTIAWNVFQHFYPYFEAVDTDWDEVLTHSLRRALKDDSKREFLRTLRRLVAQLDDGHGLVQTDALSSHGHLPFSFAWAEGKVVVTNTDTTAGDVAKKSAACAERGGVVLSMDGTPVDERLRDVKQYLSGSPQSKDYRALQRLGRGEVDTDARLAVRRGEERVECRVRRVHDRDLPESPIRPAPISKISRDFLQDTYYVDLTRAEWSQIQEKMNGLVQAENVIFDLRGHPGPSNENYKVLQHLSADSLLQMRLETPQFIYPDQDSLAGYSTARSTFPPRRPRIDAEVAFLTNAQAVSAPEGMLAVVKHHNLGAIVGQQTAGANGNVNPFLLPGGYEVRWTGMRVRKHDGSQHHLVGIRPDVRAERTIEGVRAGRDEVLETALEVLQKK
ncbi:MAG: peptidase S41, partial [Bacteroidetes bacterium QH_2_63_10]